MTIVKVAKAKMLKAKTHATGANRRNSAAPAANGCRANLYRAQVGQTQNIKVFVVQMRIINNYSYVLPL